MSRSKFYTSKAWRRVRQSVILRQGGLCNRCGKPPISKGKKKQGLIVHHKEYLDDYNYMDDSIALNEDLLEGLCIECHNKEHMTKDILREDVMFDDDGNIIKKPPQFKN